MLVLMKEHVIRYKIRMMEIIESEPKITREELVWKMMRSDWDNGILVKEALDKLIEEGIIK